MPVKLDVLHVTAVLLLGVLAFLGARLLKLILRRGRSRKPKATEELLIDVLRDKAEGAIQARADLAASEQALEALNVLHTNLIHHLPLGLIVFSETGSLIYVNPIANAWLGDSQPGQSLSDWCPELGRNFQELAGLTGARATRIKLTHGSETRDVSLSHAALPDSRRMLILQDHSDLVQLEDQLRLKRDLAFMGELASGIAHEVKNSLALMQGHLQLLALGDGEDHVTPIQGEISRLLQTVRQFMNSSKDENTQRVKVNLAELFQTLPGHWQHIPWAGKLQVEHPTQGLSLYADESQVSTLLNNLILNGMEACRGQDQDRVWVRVWAEARELGVLVCVSDQGPGFTDEALAKRFVPFVSSKDGGSGFGLFHCRKIMLQHGGTIEIQNLSPTTVSCFFPHKNPAAEGNTHEAPGGAA